MLVVANRLPVQWSDATGWRQAPGGLVTALSGVADTSIDWVGSAATLDHPANGLPSSSDTGTVRPVAVDADTAEAAVNGMANSVLWPALHGMSARVKYRTAHWDRYRAYNRVFADTVIANAAVGQRVWIHDYHLFVVPRLVKAARPDITIGLSIHTPFDAGAMSQLANAADLAVGLAGCDVIGVQTLADADQLADFLSVAPTRSLPNIVVSPVSIDPDRTIAAAHDPAAIAATAHWQQSGSRRLIVGVDRLDYTKAICERLVAYDLAFRHGIIDPDDVQIVQIAQPSRTGLVDYQALRVELERVAHQVTTTWQRSDGSPVIDVRFESFERSHVLALLAQADIAMVTPARDGMNLVAKEFSILTEHSGGALVLSNRAGAAAELGADSILVDGAQPDSVAHGLEIAVQLDGVGRHRMAQFRAQQVRSWTSNDWSDAFIGHLDSSKVSQRTERGDNGKQSDRHDLPPLVGRHNGHAGAFVNRWIGERRRRCCEAVGDATGIGMTPTVGTVSIPHSRGTRNLVDDDR